MNCWYNSFCKNSKNIGDPTYNNDNSLLNSFKPPKINCNFTTNVIPGVEIGPRVLLGFRNFAWNFKSQKNKIWGNKELVDPPCPGGINFLGVFFRIFF